MRSLSPGAQAFSPWLRLLLPWRDFALSAVARSPLETSFRFLGIHRNSHRLSFRFGNYRPQRVAKAKQLQSSVVGLNYCRATLDPIPRIVVGDTINLANRCRMNVAAQDPVNFEIARVANDSLFKLTDKTDNVLNLGFDVGAE